MMFNLFVLDISSAFPPATQFNSIASLFNLLVPTLVIGAGVVLLIMIILSGFSILQSGGNPEALKKAQKLLTYSIVGFVIIVISYVIVKLIKAIFNLPDPFF